MKIRKTICSLLLVCLAFLGIFCGMSKCICRSETGIVGNGDTAETGKRLCRAGGGQKQLGRIFPERCGWCFPVQTTPEAVHLNSA